MFAISGQPRRFKESIVFSFMVAPRGECPMPMGLRSSFDHFMSTLRTLFMFSSKFKRYLLLSTKVWEKRKEEDFRWFSPDDKPTSPLVFL